MGEEATTPPVGFTVEQARTEDGPGIRRLLGQLHPDGADRATLPQVRQESRTFVATDDQEVVGLVVATFVDYGIEAYGMVEELVVDPRRRGEHIGGALLDQARHWLRDLGADVVFVSALDAAAEAFYVAGGFVRCSGPWLYWPAAVRPAGPPAP